MKRSPQANRRLEPDARVLKALSHPFRMQLLARLNEDVMSPAALAREFGKSVPLVSYHVRALRDAGCLELVRTTPARGAVEHHYRATRRALYSDAEWDALGRDARQSVTATLLRAAISDAFDALQSGNMDARPDRHVSFTTVNLDERAWNELNEMLESVVYAALRLEAETAARQLEPEAAQPIRSRLTILHYESVPGRPLMGGESSVSKPAGNGRKRT